MIQPAKPAIHTFITVGVVVLIAVLASSSAAVAQDSKASWILGVWEGKHSGPRISGDETRFEFVADGDVMLFKFNV